MTSPPSVTEAEPSPEDEQDLSRVTVAIGGRLLDFGLPHGVAVSVLADEVIEIVRGQYGGADDLSHSEGAWTFARLVEGPADPDQSLADAGVQDGEVLTIVEAAKVFPALMVDHLPGTEDPPGWWAVMLRRHGQRTVWFVLAIMLSIAAAGLLPALAGAPMLGAVPIGSAASLVAGVSVLVGAWVAPFRAGAAGSSAWLAAIALPLVFGGSLYVIPGAHGVDALPMAMALISLIALTQLTVTGRGRALHTAVIVVTVLCAPAAVVHLTSNPNPRAIGAVLAAAAVIVVHLAPKSVITLARLPVPTVPTAGEPLDDIEIQGGTTVDGVNALGRVVPTEEGMSERVRRASQYLTGIVVAAAVAAIAGCYLAADVSDGFYWQGLVFGFAVATALCLRGRSHHDLAQATVLIGGGMVIAVMVIVKTALSVDGWQVNAALLLMVLSAVVMVCGLVAPSVEFSPVMRRWVEIGDYVAIALVIPLACWIVGVYAFFRELQL